MTAEASTSGCSRASSQTCLLQRGVLLSKTGLTSSVGHGVRRIVGVPRRLLARLRYAAIRLPLARVIVQSRGDFPAGDDGHEVGRAGPLVVVPGLDGLEVRDVFLRYDLGEQRRSGQRDRPQTTKSPLGVQGIQRLCLIAGSVGRFGLNEQVLIGGDERLREVRREANVGDVALVRVEVVI